MKKLLYIGGLVAALGLAVVFLTPASERPAEQGATETSTALETDFSHIWWHSELKNTAEIQMVNRISQKIYSMSSVAISETY